MYIKVHYNTLADTICTRYQEIGNRAKDRKWTKEEVHLLDVLAEIIDLLDEAEKIDVF